MGRAHISSVLVSISFIIFVACIVWTFLSPLKKSIEFAITIDAGSSHTGIKVFQLYRLKSDSNQLSTYQISHVDECESDVSLKDAWMPDLENLSLSNLTAYDQTDKKTLSGVLNELSTCVESILAKQYRDLNDDQSQKNALIRLVFGATAGLRLYQHVKQLKTEVILSRTQLHLLKWLIPQNNISRDWLPEEFDFLGIISGQDEALFSCIAVNNQYWNQKSMASQSIKHPKAKSLVNNEMLAERGRLKIGMMELGGASLQFAYPVNDAEDDLMHNIDTNNRSTNISNEEVYSAAHLLNIRLYPDQKQNVRIWKDQKVYVTSQLCFGLNEFRMRVLLLLMIAAQNNDQELIHPCYSSDYNETIRTDFLLTRTCLLRIEPNTDSTLFNSTIADKYSIRGSFDSKACISLIQSALDIKWCENHFQYCPTSELPKPPKTMHFQGISNFYYATRALDANLDTITWDDYVVKRNEWCKSNNQTDRQDLKRVYSIHFCLSLHYIDILVHEMFGLPREQFSHIHFNSSNKGKSSSVDWAQGYLLHSLINQLSINKIHKINPIRSNESTEFLTDNIVSFNYNDLCAQSSGLNIWIIVGFIISIVCGVIGILIRWQYSKKYNP